jgi:hypothetical protein
MGVAWERHGMCELAFTLLDFMGINKLLPIPSTFTVSLAEMWCTRSAANTCNAAEHL